MRSKTLPLFVFLVMTLAALAPVYAFASPTDASPQGAPTQAGQGVTVTLTLLHNNDGESSLLPIINGVATTTGTVNLETGSVAAFKTRTDMEIADARADGHAVIDVYAGDAFLASATLACSLPPNPPETPVYDAVAQRQIPYDAHVFGNHEFDFGPDFLLDFIQNFEQDGELSQPFLSSNLDFSAAAGYDMLIDSDGLIVGQTTDGHVIAHSLIHTDTETGESFGIVGATTWTLPTISSPGDVQVTTSNITDTATVVQEEIDRLYDDYGVHKIILVSHLQDIDNDEDLVLQLSRVDIAVAGGGDELLVSPAVPTDTQLLPGEQAPIEGDYPLQVSDADGRTVYLVTTAGNYKYLGRLDVEFDSMGEVSNLVEEESYPRRVIPESDVATLLELDDAVAMDPGIVETVNEPVEACLEEFANTPIARTEVLLDVSRNGVRNGESNAGDLVADGYLYVYEQFYDENGLPAPSEVPVIAIQNGGGIRQNAGDILPIGGSVPGTITRLNTLDVMAFLTNFTTAVEGVTPEDLKAILEHSASVLPGGGGAFLQIGGFEVTYDLGFSVDERVRTVTLEDGTAIVVDGMVVEDAPDMTLVTNSFTAAGGDNYTTLADIPSEDKTNLVDDEGVTITYEGSLVEYLLSFPLEEGLPTIQDDDPRYTYPDGEGRITILDKASAVTVNALAVEQGPSGLWLLAAGALLLGVGAVGLLRRR